MERQASLGVLHGERRQRMKEEQGKGREAGKSKISRHGEQHGLEG